jgi:hypothetical protein
MVRSTTHRRLSTWKPPGLGISGDDFCVDTEGGGVFDKLVLETLVDPSLGYRRVECLGLVQDLNTGSKIGHRNVRFDKIPQPWLKALVKRRVRLQLAAGRSPGHAINTARAATVFALFLEGSRSPRPHRSPARSLSGSWHTSPGSGTVPATPGR